MTMTTAMPINTGSGRILWKYTCRYIGTKDGYSHIEDDTYCNEDDTYCKCKENDDKNYKEDSISLRKWYQLQQTWLREEGWVGKGGEMVGMHAMENRPKAIFVSQDKYCLDLKSWSCGADEDVVNSANTSPSQWEKTAAKVNFSGTTALLYSTALALFFFSLAKFLLFVVLDVQLFLPCDHRLDWRNQLILWRQSRSK